MSEEQKEMTPEELLAQGGDAAQEATQKAQEEAAHKQAEQAAREAVEKRHKEEEAKKRAAAEEAAKAKAKAAEEERKRKEKEAADLQAKKDAEAKAAAEAAKQAEEAKKAAEAEEARKKEEAARKEAEAAKAAQAPKAVDPEPQAPTVIVVRPAAKKVESPMASKRRAVVQSIQNEVSEDPRMHTQAGRALIRKFNEYIALCRACRKNNSADISKCAHKLYEIVVDCCPHAGSRNAAYYRELIMIVFKRLSQGYGTLFTDAKLFRGDYNLPSAQDAMKFDAFWSAMFQLVEASKTGSRITFNSKTLGQILGSPSAMNVINQLRQRLEAVREN